MVQVVPLSVLYATPYPLYEVANTLSELYVIPPQHPYVMFELVHVTAPSSEYRSPRSLSDPIIILPFLLAITAAPAARPDFHVCPLSVLVMVLVFELDTISLEAIIPPSRHQPLLSTYIRL